MIYNIIYSLKIRPEGVIEFQMCEWYFLLVLDKVHGEWQNLERFDLCCWKCCHKISLVIGHNVDYLATWGREWDFHGLKRTS